MNVSVWVEGGGGVEGGWMGLGPTVWAIFILCIYFILFP